MPTADTITGAQLKAMFAAGRDWLALHADAVNALNVFPVPDGDTGVNMLLTMQSALKRSAGLPADHAGRLALRVAEDALLGARGNSGVILSQILLGFAGSIREQAVISLPDFAVALQAASDMAYGAVIKPVEGTILTIIKALAHHSRHLAQATPDIEAFLSQLLAGANRTLQTTPNLLPALHQAGVVDSGGQGLVYILEGMTRHVKKLPVSLNSDATRPHKQLSDAVHTARPGELNHPYDVQFIIQGHSLNLSEIRQQISALGSSPLVVGDARLARVHLHTADPEKPLQYGASQGAVLDIVVEDMAAQSRAFLNGRRNGPLSAKANPSVAGVLCVVPGPGFGALFTGLGSNGLVYAEYGASLESEQLVTAIDKADEESLIVLPNGRAFLPAVQQAVSRSGKRVHIIPTGSVPAGLNALLAFNSDVAIKTNLRRMQQAARQVDVLEIQRDQNDRHYVAYHNGVRAVSGQTARHVCLETCSTLDIDAFELLTIYYGAGVSDRAAHSLSQTILARYPHLESEILDGGQRHYLYIISLE